MTQCVLHGAATAAPHGWLCDVGVAIYDFQTLIAGVLAIGAAYYAARPVWRQLRDSNLQTKIQHRETLAGMLREAQDRFGRSGKSIAQPMVDLDRLTSDPAGEPIPIGPHDAFAIEQRLQGELDWYLVDLRATEAEPVEAAKALLKEALDELLNTLNDVHWCEHNEQHDEDHSIPDDEWAAILVRSKEAELLAGDKAATARKALRALGDAQAAWVTSLRARIAKLDLEIAASS
jgi:hypothetical protein